MEREDLTPEERLLRLIRRAGHKAKKTDAPSEAKDANAGSAGGQQPLANDDNKIMHLVFKSPDLAVAGVGEVSRYKFIETGLIVFFCLLTAYFIFDISIASRKVALPTPQAVSDIGKELSKFSFPELTIGPYSNYSGVFGKRNIFTRREQAFSADAVSSEDVSKAVSNLTLMGVVNGASQQAIIFDKGTQKSYFLGVGESLGDFVVDTIESGKVILNYRGEKVEIYL